MKDENILSRARAAAETVLLSRVSPLVGKDYKNSIPKLKTRIAAIRAGNGDNMPEVQSVVAAFNLLRVQIHGPVVAEAIMDAGPIGCCSINERNASEITDAITDALDTL